MLKNLLAFFSKKLKLKHELILKATQGLDGAFAEQYVNIVRKLCYNNLERFIDVLSTLEDKQALSIKSSPFRF
ncbi:hypothetical protein ACRB80_00940 [Thermoanaerobacter mathranii]